MSRSRPKSRDVSRREGFSTMKTQTPAAEPSASCLAPITDVLGRVARELAHLGLLLDDLESVLGPLILEAGRGRADVLRDAQGLDHIGQKLSCLADFLTALAAAAPRQWLVDQNIAGRVVTLADLALRLKAAGANVSPADFGDCELF
jgi:hypothetical protein